MSAMGNETSRQKFAVTTQLTSDEIKRRIERLFIDFIVPANVLHVFGTYNPNILTSGDKERVRAVTDQRGNQEGAALLLNLLSRYDNWYPCLLNVLEDSAVKLPHLADIMDQTIRYGSGDRDERGDDWDARDGDRDARDGDCDARGDAGGARGGDCSARTVKSIQFEMDNDHTQRSADDILQVGNDGNGESSTGNSILPKKVVNILLVGKTGAGKSSSGNSILSKEAFKSSNNLSSVTRDVHFDYTEFEKYTIKVVDTPGYLDTRVRPREQVKELTKALRKALAITPEGYHAIVVVLSATQRYTEENSECLKTLRKILGPKFVTGHTVLVMSGGDTLFGAEGSDSSKFEKWCDDQDEPFAQLYNECQKRAVLFDNRTQSEETKLQQMTQLMQKIDSMVRGNRSESLVFRITSMASKMYLQKVTGSINAEDVVRELTIIIPYLSSVNPATHEQDTKEAKLRVTKHTQMKGKYSREIQAIVGQFAALALTQRDLSRNYSERVRKVRNENKTQESNLQARAQRETTRTPISRNTRPVREKAELERKREQELTEIQKEFTTKFQTNASELIKEFSEFKKQQMCLPELGPFEQFIQWLFDFCSGLN